MDLPSHADIVEQIDGFLTRQDMAPSRFGRDALGEPQFVSQVRAGRMPSVSTLVKLRDFMKERDDLELAIPPIDNDNGQASHRLNAGGR